MLQTCETLIAATLPAFQRLPTVANGQLTREQGRRVMSKTSTRGCKPFVTQSSGPQAGAEALRVEGSKGCYRVRPAEAEFDEPDQPV